VAGCRDTPVYSLIAFGVGVVVYLVAVFHYVSADFIVLGFAIMTLAETLGMIIEMEERHSRCLRMRWQELRKELCEKYNIECPGDACGAGEH